jgi:methylthioribose-1-phosphate isomerase
MRVGDKSYQSIWFDGSDPTSVKIINQQKLPFMFEIAELRSVEDVFNAIRDMTVRGAPLIGAAGAFGIYLSLLEISSLTNIRQHIENAARYLKSSRPTAVNLQWAVDLVCSSIDFSNPGGKYAESALNAALSICHTETEKCRLIGTNGLPLLESISVKKNGQPVNVLTHCNAGWLACIDYGTALAPVYLAHEKGIPVHVWVDETRPRNQGTKLTAWELGEAGIPYTLIADNTGGHLMQHGMVDIVLVGADRITAKGDTANKIGTYLKALAAYDNKVPFYVAAPGSTFDLSLSNGLREIPVEEREEEELCYISGELNNEITRIRIAPVNCRASNYGFDVTPARLITGIITEKGICNAEENTIVELFSEN